MDDDDNYPNFSAAFSYAPTTRVATPLLQQQQQLLQQRSEDRPSSSSSSKARRPTSLISPAGLRPPSAPRNQAPRLYQSSLNIQFPHYQDHAPPKAKPRFTLGEIGGGTIARRRALTGEGRARGVTL